MLDDICQISPHLKKITLLIFSKMVRLLTSFWPAFSPKWYFSLNPAPCFHSRNNSVTDKKQRKLWSQTRNEYLQKCKRDCWNTGWKFEAMSQAFNPGTSFPWPKSLMGYNSKFLGISSPDRHGHAPTSRIHTSKFFHGSHILILSSSLSNPLKLSYWSSIISQFS